VRVPPSDEVALEMTDVDKLHDTLTTVLVAIGEIRETLRQQDQRTAQFWARDWPNLEGRVSATERSHIEAAGVAAALTRIERMLVDQDTRIERTERLQNDLAASIRTLRGFLVIAVSVGGLILATIR